jgi:hypothetical protein
MHAGQTNSTGWTGWPPESLSASRWGSIRYRCGCNEHITEDRWPSKEECQLRLGECVEVMRRPAVTARSRRRAGRVGGLAGLAVARSCGEDLSDARGVGVRPALRSGHRDPRVEHQLAVVVPVSVGNGLRVHQVRGELPEGHDWVPAHGR